MQPRPSPAFRSLVTLLMVGAFTACSGSSDEASDETTGAGGTSTTKGGAGGTSSAGKGGTSAGGAASGAGGSSSGAGGSGGSGGSSPTTGGSGGSVSTAGGSGGSGPTTGGSGGSDPTAGGSGGSTSGGGGSEAGGAPPACDNPGPPGPDGPPAALNVDVQGNDILLNGQKWVPHGMIFEGFLVPLDQAQECVDKGLDAPNEFCKRHVESRDYYYGKGKYACQDALTLAAKNWKVNSIRLNLDQAALDADSPQFSQAYVDEVKQAVNHARARGFVVVAAIFSERNDNAPQFVTSKDPPTQLSTAASKGAAVTLAKLFGEDRGVLIEMLNEPFLLQAGLNEGWNIWINGGSHGGVNYVGVNEIINAIRNKDAKNAIIVQGIVGTFVGYPGGITDPKNRLIFSAHPFLTGGDKEDVNWYARFGDFAGNHPFTVTAWDTSAGDPWCGAIGVQTAPRFVQYLEARKFGLFGFAFDVGSSVTKDFRDHFDQPTQFPDACGSGHGGTLVQAAFNGTLGPLANQAPVIKGVNAPDNVKAGGAAKIVVNADDVDNTAAHKEHITYAFRMDGQPQSADSDRQYGETLTWNVPNNAKGKKKLTISAVDPFGARDEKNVTINVQ